jgi:YggT family protein
MVCPFVHSPKERWPVPGTDMAVLALGRKPVGQRESTAMGVEAAIVAPLADAADRISNLIDVFVTVYIILILAYILSAWFRLPYSPWLNRIQRFLYDVCEPYLRIFRRFVPPLGPLDLSPMVAVLVLVIAREIAVRLLTSS